MKKRFQRKFLGKIDGFIDKREQDFEKKHLSAYLKGHERFADGFEKNAEGNPIMDSIVNQAGIVMRYERRPKYYPVKQELIEVK